MTHVITGTAFALGLALTSPLLAGNESRMEAFPYKNGLVEVVADFSEDAIYWCGAARFVQTELTGDRPKRIYVWQGPSASASKPGEKSVKFGFTPPETSGNTPSFSNSVDYVGNSMSLAQASQTCNERSASG
ncbi:MAG: hypothetical protein AB3N13_11735 [Arenibacterium sp.]